MIVRPHENPNGEFEQSARWCEGSGAYEGLKAYMTEREEGIFGFISSGDGPPMPEGRQRADTHQRPIGSGVPDGRPGPRVRGHIGHGPLQP